MTNSEIKALSLEELREKLVEEKATLSKLRFAHTVTPIENPMKLKETRKLIARLHTEVSAKEISQKQV